MKTALECIPCFINQAIRAFKTNGESEERIIEILPDLLELLKGVDFDRTPMENASVMYRFISGSLGVEDVYRAVKKAHNEIFLKGYQRFKEIVMNSDDRLRRAIELSCSANLVDLGSRDVSTKDVFEEVISYSYRSFYLDHYKILREELTRARSLVYFLDNAGEAVLDMLLVETIVEEFPNLSRVIVIAKERPFINDITRAEALEMGFTRIPRVSVIGIYPSSDKSPNYWSEDIRKLIHDADVVIAKGQANFEALDVPKVYHLFYVKCSAVSKCIGAPIGSPVLFKRANSHKIC